MDQVKTINHLGQVVYQESVEFYKEKLSVYSKDFLQNSLIPQLYEWSNAYKAAVELTNKKPQRGRKGVGMAVEKELIALRDEDIKFVEKLLKK